MHAEGKLTVVCDNAQVADAAQHMLDEAIPNPTSPVTAYTRRGENIDVQIYLPLPLPGEQPAS